jgi:hypothetical protein
MHDIVNISQNQEVHHACARTTAHRIANELGLQMGS